MCFQEVCSGVSDKHQEFILAKGSLSWEDTDILGKDLIDVKGMRQYKCLHLLYKAALLRTQILKRHKCRWQQLLLLIH